MSCSQWLFIVIANGSLAASYVTMRLFELAIQQS